MDKFKAMLLAYVATQFGITEEGAAELLLTKSEDGTVNVETAEPLEDALAILINKDKERVSSLRVDKTAIFDDAFAKAKTKVLSQAEKNLIKEYSVEGADNMKLPEIVAAIVEKHGKGTKKTEISEADIKKHPLFLKLEQDSAAALATQKEAFETQIQGIEAQKAEETLLQEVLSLVSTHLDDYNPVLPKDTARAGKQRKDFIDSFKGRKYQKVNGSGFILLNEEGTERADDGHGNPVYLKDFAYSQAAATFDQKAQSGKGNGGNEGVAGGGGAAKVYETEDEYNLAMLNANSAEERSQINESWKASNT